MPSPPIGRSAIAFLVLVSASHAGPCADDIAGTQARVDAVLAAKAAAGPSAVESTRARMSRQPTPRSLARAEERLRELSPQAFAAITQGMADARAADAAGNKRACAQALAGVRRALKRPN